jgi:hypothetical protein
MRLEMLDRQCDEEGQLELLHYIMLALQWPGRSRPLQRKANVAKEM